MPTILVRHFLPRLLVLLPILVQSNPLVADDAADLRQAYYLQHARHDYSGAKRIYDRLAGDDQASDEIRREAAERSRYCRDRLAASDLAGLVPADLMAYVEIRNPLELVGSLMQALGLGGRDMAAALGDRPDADSTAPLHLPSRITISPRLLEALGAFGGVAVAVTDLREDGSRGRGVVIVDHGDVALLRGLLETAFQFAPTARRIADMPTFAIRDEAVGVLSDGLLIVGTDRAVVEDVVTRLEGRSAETLASRPDLKELHERRRGATLFAFADGPRCVAQARRMAQQPHQQAELARADAVLDLDSLRWAAFAFGLRDRSLGAELTVRLADNHRNLVFDLLRLPSMSRASFAYVPADAAAVVGLGLNPPFAPRREAEEATDDRVAVTGLDILREIFGNLHEAAAFVVPGKGTPAPQRGPRSRGAHLPDAAVVIASSDVERSAALWDRLLSVPGRMADKPIEPRVVDLGGTEARAYAIPGAAEVFVCQTKEVLLIGTTRVALRRALQARRSGRSIDKDAEMKHALSRLPADSSLMLVIHGGRCAALAAAQVGGPQAMPLNLASTVLRDSVVWAGIGQSRSELSLRLGLAGLPDLNELVKLGAPFVQMLGSRPEPSPRPAQRRIEGKPPPPRDADDDDDSA